MKASELLTFIGGKLGMDLTPHLSGIENDIELSDEIKTHFDKDFFTFESAQNNPRLKNHFTSLALNAIDSTLNEQFQAYGFSEEEITDLKAIKNTYERQRKFGEILASKKQQPTAVNDDQVKSLNQQILELKRANQQERDNYISEYENKFRNFVLNEALLKRPLDIDRFGDSDTALTIARMKLDKELSDKGIDLKRTDKDFKLVQKQNPEQDYYVDNVPAQFDAFLDRLLADNKLLKISGPADSPVNTPTNIVPPGNLPPNGTMLNKLEQAKADFNRGSLSFNQQ